MYGLSARKTPPPAVISDELVVDVLKAKLVYDPLPLDQYGQTHWAMDGPLITINVLAHEIPGVKDPEGVQNVAKFHEAVHVISDGALLRRAPVKAFPGFDVPGQGACLASATRQSQDWKKHCREVWAEEAGRAAAVCYRSLARSESFQHLLLIAKGARSTNGERWRMLVEAAHDIGVNRSALVRQLELEGRIFIEQEGSSSVVYLQSSFKQCLNVI